MSLILNLNSESSNNTLDMYEKNIKKLEEDIAKLEEAKVILQYVSLETQNMIKTKFVSLVNECLGIIFHDKYEFVLEFKESSNGMSAEIGLLNKSSGIVYDPVNANGGGLVDVIAFTLRVVMFLLMHKKRSCTFILDEPFKNISENYRYTFMYLIRKISEKYNLQFIIVTHIDAIKEHSDRVIEVSLDKGVSYVS